MTTNLPNVLEDVNLTVKETMPIPIYVTAHGKVVSLRFNTQAEADRAWRILGRHAAEHADRTQKKQLENKK